MLAKLDICYKASDGSKSEDYTKVIGPYVEAFREYLLSIPAVCAFFEREEDDKAFFAEQFEAKDLLRVKGKNMQTEVFYALKNGVVLKGVPGRLYYLIKKSWTATEAPNTALARLPQAMLLSMSDNKLPEGTCIADVLKHQLRSDFTRLSLEVPKVSYGNISELLVKRDDKDAYQICVCDSNLVSGLIRPEDVLKLRLDKAHGVYMANEEGSKADYKEYLRFWGGKLGITEHDLDLRRVR